VKIEQGSIQVGKYDRLGPHYAVISRKYSDLDSKTLIF
jgi:hypothetical protein